MINWETFLFWTLYQAEIYSQKSFVSTRHFRAVVVAYRLCLPTETRVQFLAKDFFADYDLHSHFQHQLLQHPLGLSGFSSLAISISAFPVRLALVPRINFCLPSTFPLELLSKWSISISVPNLPMLGTKLRGKKLCCEFLLMKKWEIRITCRCRWTSASWAVPGF